MATSTVMSKSIEIVEDILDILRQTRARLDPTAVQDYARLLESANEALNDAAVEIEREGEAQSTSDRMAWPVVISQCMDGLNSNVIIPLGKNIKSSGAGEWQVFSNRFHEVRAKVEELGRMVEMIDDPTEEELEQMLWWVNELGTKEHLGWLLQVRNKLPDRLKELQEIADRHVSERVSAQYDPGRRLQSFFGLDQREFAHIISNPAWTQKPSTALPNQSPIETLAAIREKLGGSFSQAQAGRWLREPAARLNGKSPIDAIKEGRCSSVLQLLDEPEFR